MPYKPKKPCAYNGCPELTDSRYCSEHTKLMHRHYNKYQRNSNHSKRYGGSWRKISKGYRQANPLCEHCKADGRLTPADLVHHKVKLTDGGTNDTNNLVALCISCHSRLHTKQGDCF